MIHYKELTRYLKVWLKTEEEDPEDEEWEVQKVELIAAEIGMHYYKREELPAGMEKCLLLVLEDLDKEGWEYY